MRSFKTLLLAVAAVLSILAACRKDTINPAAGAHTGGPKSEDCNFDVTIECDMLSFTDAAHFAEVRDCLDARYEAFIDWLEQEYGTLDDDAFEEAVDLLGTNEDQEIIAFLNSVGFYSYWNMYEDALNQFTDGGGEPWNFTMPNPFSSPIDAALRNPLGAVMIGGVIHVTLPNGDQWTFCDCDAYQAYAADPTGYVDDPNNPCDDLIEKQIFTGTGGIECADYWKMCHWNNYANRRSMKVKLDFTYTVGTGTQVTANLDSWKRKNNGRWKRFHVKLRPRTFGNSGTLECTFRGSFDKTRTTRRARTRWASVLWDGQHRTFRRDEAYGDYLWAGSVTDGIELDWNEPVCWN
jgi:hypothetical protein